ncbi:MAG: ABC transporter ATP-binding protein [Gammaproteobacteria bacterium]|nr:ABC transporter ATP-binding protein [Gammaproteobacteria bacterium]MYE30930.1 ABC transporter ATP-binding protein [Gammaproteobacteria bacterium]MYI02186.1 ABC transporter ATP-binding protein [Gammaproteobacteria bacterium]
MKNFVIELAGISKIFATSDIETHALSDVSLGVKKGEFVSIAGPSGCGKSTLLSILGLLHTPSGGNYKLAGQTVDGLSSRARARARNEYLGFVFQTFNLIGSLTAAQNVELPLLYRGLAKRERKRKADEALERVDMSHRGRHYPMQLSGGQQQRVAVARAIVGAPEVILADEPTGNLDSSNGEMVMDLLAQLHAGGATVCMVTHDPRYTSFSERTVHLFDGKLVADEARPA